MTTAKPSPGQPRDARPTRNQIWAAAKAGRLAEVKELLNNGATPEASFGGWTLLGFALRNGLSEIALALLDAGADPLREENGKSMFELACTLPDARVLLQRMCQDKQPPEDLLRTAAYSGKEPVIEHLLEIGCDPLFMGANGEDDRKGLALTCWPAKKGPAPMRLVSATMGKGFPNAAAQAIAIWLARRGSEDDLANALATNAWTPKQKNVLLYHVAQSSWRQGVAMVLESGVDPGAQDPRFAPVLLGIVSRLQRKKKKNADDAWQILDDLIEAGFDLDMIHPSNAVKSLDAKCQGLSAALLLVQRVPADAMPRLLRVLADKGASPISRGTPRWPGNTTIAHQVMARQQWPLLSELPKLWPFLASWEVEGEPLLRAWSEHHPTARQMNDKDDMDAFQTLHAVAALPGFDVHAVNERGLSGLRRLLGRNHSGNMPFNAKSMHSPEVLVDLVEVLVKMGADPNHVDQEGVSDFDVACNLDLGEHFARMEALAIGSAAHLAPSAPSRPRRL